MNKKILATILTIALICTMSVSVFAASDYVNSTGSEADDISNTAVTGQDTYQDKQSEYYDAISEDSSAVPCEVYATQADGEDIYDPDNENADSEGYVDGSVGVIIPKVIILSGKSGYGEYSVWVKGNIAGDECISVVPDASVTLSQRGKADITATITQPVQRFAVATSTLADASDLAKTVTTNYSDTTTNGSIQATGLSAGAWSGTFNFSISIN